MDSGDFHRHDSFDDINAQYAQWQWGNHFCVWQKCCDFCSTVLFGRALPYCRPLVLRFFRIFVFPVVSAWTGVLSRENHQKNKINRGTIFVLEYLDFPGLFLLRKELMRLPRFFPPGIHEIWASWNLFTILSMTYLILPCGIANIFFVYFLFPPWYIGFCSGWEWFGYFLRWCFMYIIFPECKCVLNRCSFSHGGYLAFLHSSGMDANFHHYLRHSWFSLSFGSVVYLFLLAKQTLYLCQCEKEVLLTGNLDSYLLWSGKLLIFLGIPLFWAWLDLLPHAWIGHRWEIASAAFVLYVIHHPLCAALKKNIL